MNRSFFSKSYDNSYVTDAIFLFRKPLQSTLISFKTNPNNTNLNQRDDVKTTGKLTSKERFHSVYDTKKLKIQRNIQIKRKITSVANF